MRRSDTSFVFTIIVLAQALLACGADAAGPAPPAVSNPEMAQAPASLAPPLAELLARAKSLSSSGKLRDAYELLDAAEVAYFGLIEFDYALGRAAFDAGRPDKATLAFARVLAIDPSRAGAVKDLWRAYLAPGNYDQANAAGPAPPAVPNLKIAQAPASAASPPLAGLLARAKSLSSSGKLRDAYELLDGAEDTYFGEIEFDYALGRAALEAGRPDKATLALFRVLALDPGHAGALIDIGRAYLALGNYEQARVTFATLLGLNPPPAVRGQLQSYLEQARAAGKDLSPKSAVRWQRGYLAATFGRSTNVNQSPGQPQVFVPAFGATYQLSNQNVKKPDGFAGLMGGVEASLPLNDTYSLVGGGEFAERRNNHESSFDLGGLGARLGIAAATQTQLLRVQFSKGRDYLGDSPSRDTNALGLDYFKSIGADTQLLAFTQAGRWRHPPLGLSIYDANFVTLGLGASRNFVGGSTAFVVISTGRQGDVGGNASGDKRQLGLRLGAEAAILAGWKLIGNVGWDKGQYDRFDPSFLTVRYDFRRYYELGLQYALGPRTSLRLGLAQTDQRSNISIYEYDRTDRSLTLRYDFQ
jgi:tetratricopeptide (TPR) repeat protein